METVLNYLREISKIYVTVETQYGEIVCKNEIQTIETEDNGLRIISNNGDEMWISFDDCEVELDVENGEISLTYPTERMTILCI